MSDQPKKDNNTYLMSVKPRHPHLRHIPMVHDNDMQTLVQKENEYDASWKKRGGVGAFMMLARKWDRIEAQVLRQVDTYNIFDAIRDDKRDEGILDDIRDLRRYLALVEAFMIEQNVVGPPAMERTNWDSLNAASREIEHNIHAMTGNKFDTDQGQDREFDPNDRPLTEMIRRDQ